MRPMLPLLLLLLASWPHRKAFARRRKCPGSLSEDKIIREVFRNYTKMLPDSEHPDESVHVQIEMHVQDMGSLNEISADFEIDFLFTQIWHDPSLSFQNLSSQCVSNITMESRFIQDIWIPNTCIINAKKTAVHASPTDNIMFILYENGTVWINHRLSVKAPCNLDLRTFPFDTQTCVLLFESYSHNSEEVTLHWMTEPITLMKQITLPDFDMIQFDTKRETLLYPNGYWDELQASFTFKRRYGFYILQAYVPTYLTIIVSWVGFCMEPKALPARTTVGVSSLLALTLQFGNIHKNLPRVSYVKAMDVWMLGCISFVFGTMIELAIVCYITRCQSSRHAKRRLAAMAARYNNGGTHSPSQQRLHHFLPSRRSLSALLAAGDMPDGMQSCLEANMFGLYGGPSRSSSMRMHSMPVPAARNGTLPQQRKILSGSSLGPFFFNRRRKRQSATGQDGLLSAADDSQPCTDRPPVPPQLVLPEETSMPMADGRRLQGNGDLRIPKSVSGHSLNGGDQRSMSFWPDQLSSTLLAPLGRAHQWYNLARGRSEDAEENWPIIQPESIDKLSIVVFPLAFTLFNLIYWWYYLSLGGQFDPQGLAGANSSPSIEPALSISEHIII